MKHLKVMADPEWAGKHPLHDNRFICTEDTVFGDECHEAGSIIAKMTDCREQKEYAQKLVLAFNLHDELVGALKEITNRGYLDPKIINLIDRAEGRIK